MAISIELCNLHKKIANQVAIQNLSVRFDAGKLHGLIGAEGAGKTTTMRLMLKLLNQNGGEIIFRDGQKILSFLEIREQISYMPSRQSLYGDLSIAEHLDFFRDLYQVPREQYLKRREELLQITRLEKYQDRKASELSGGMYKKLGLMCALLQSPLILLLDEPTNGVDPISRREFWDLLYRLLTPETMIIIATAYMDEAERCHQVYLYDKGQLLASGEPRELLQQEGVESFDQFFLRREGLTKGERI